MIDSAATVAAWARAGAVERVQAGAGVAESII
jgi:hypothetical protein